MGFALGSGMLIAECKMSSLTLGMLAWYVKNRGVGLNGIGDFSVYYFI